MFHLEPLIWTVRGGEDFATFGDNYNFVCTVTKSGPKSCRITAAVGKLPVQAVKPFLKHLNAIGFDHIDWERAKDLK